MPSQGSVILNGFFAELQAEGLHVIPHVLPDHAMFRKEDITFADGLPVVMTEKMSALAGIRLPDGFGLPTE